MTLRYVLLPAALALTAAAPPPGALSCSGCHPPADKPTEIPAIAGRPAAVIVGALDEFRSGKRPAMVMNRIATGFTPAELGAIAAWWSEQ